MEKIGLSENHKRSISASMYLVERIADDLERKLAIPSELVMSKIVKNKDADLQHCMSVLKEIKSHVGLLAAKYSLRTSEVSLTQIINSSKSAMWEILCDTTSQRLKGYGRFPKEYAAEFDADIDALQNLISKI